MADGTVAPVEQEHLAITETAAETETGENGPAGTGEPSKLLFLF